MAAQRLSFVGAPGQWSVNGRVVGSGSLVHWLPRPGRFVLERRSDTVGHQGPADRVSFEVRATPPPARR
jgi:hypothetical protein